MICNLEFLFSNTQTKCKGKNLQITDSKLIESVKSRYTKEKKCQQVVKLIQKQQKLDMMQIQNIKMKQISENAEIDGFCLYIIFINQLIIQWIINIKIYNRRFQLIVYNYFNMKNIILVLALTYLATSAPVIVVRSQTDDLIILPGPPHTATQNTYPYNVNLGDSGAVWIWDKNWNNPSAPSPIIVTDNFNANCLSEMTLYATADNNFTATLNTNDILSGDDWRKIFTVNFIPKCGRNIFSIKAWNEGIASQTNPAGLVYWISQDPSSCYKCKDGQTWNPESCSCQCADHCPCRRNQSFSVSSCQCICAKVQSCDSGLYWDQNSCSCKCLRKLCPASLIWNFSTCSCVKSYYD